MDCLLGLVTRVVDDETFDVTVVSQGQTNRDTYGRCERIHIPPGSGMVQASAGPGGRWGSGRLLFGTSVSLTVHGRDSSGRLLCDVRLLSV
ncbi:MAG TPA: hypothetical protein ENI92_03085 [Bacteroidetes bacterium]|nr:hypothetical protein [Bacteroidota bacterium]